MNAERFYDKAYSWLLNIGPRIIIALLVIIIGHWILRQIRRLTAREMREKELAPSLQQFILNFIFTALQVLLVFTALQIVGIQMTIFATVIGALGVAAGLALSGTLQNFTSGLLILMFKPFRVGDSILSQGMEGVVTNIAIFYTVVKSHDNKTIIIPNSKLSNDVIVNLSREGARGLDIELKVPFSINFEQVKAVVEHTASNIQELLAEPQIKVGVSGIEADGYRIIIHSWLPVDNYYDVRLRFQGSLVDAFKTNGIKLPGL